MDTIDSENTLTNSYLHSAQRVIREEIAAIQAMGTRLDNNFNHACRLLQHTKGRIIVLGVGKSGHIARKIAATFASTGSPAHFVHPAEASHGDLGMITKQDVVIAISYSGKTRELLSLIAPLQRLQAPIIAITGSAESRLAKHADVHLNVHVDKEACPLNLAPTSSTTATLVLGDALAVALTVARGFTANDFALSHPGGNLGQRLLLSVGDIMRHSEKISTVTATTPIAEALLSMTQNGLGATVIVDDEQRLLGIFTDGDLRRTLQQSHDLQNTAISSVMSNKPYTIAADIKAQKAIELMEQHKVNVLLITNAQQQLLGAINMHDLLTTNVV